MTPEAIRDTLPIPVYLSRFVRSEKDKNMMYEENEAVMGHGMVCCKGVAVFFLLFIAVVGI